MREEHKLTDADINAFVATLKPAAMLAMYHKNGLSQLGSVLKHLACLRPEEIVPDLLARMEESLETLTEPHKLTASMQAVVSAARTIVYPGGSVLLVSNSH